MYYYSPSHLLLLSVCDIHMHRSLEVLKGRIEELERVESELVRSETRVKDLERKLRTFRHSEEFLQSQQQKVLQYDELHREVVHLREENVALKRQQDNTDLLRYKVQTLQEKCAKFEGLEMKLAQLELENKQLKEKQAGEEMALEGEVGMEVKSAIEGVGGGGGGSQAALWYKIAELQQKEVLLTAKQGELVTRWVKINQGAGGRRCMLYTKFKEGGHDSLVPTLSSLS